eukprot:1923444-Alexandrium_andersonii.AAC.1
MCRGLRRRAGHRIARTGLVPQRQSLRMVRRRRPWGAVRHQHAGECPRRPPSRGSGRGAPAAG